MKNSLKEKFYYRLERFMSKGGSSIFLSLLVLFIFSFLILMGLRLLLITLFPGLDYNGNPFRDIWITFLEMTATGNMNQDNLAPAWLKIMTVISGLTGVILLSMLIGFITTSLNKMLYEFRKGRGKIIESDHTLILGWNERVVDIIRELILANESERKACVVILAEADKEYMDDLISKRLPNTMTTEIITTQGDYANINELERVNVKHSKSIIILANCTESASKDKKVASDVQSIKSILAITSCQGGKNELPIVAEVFTEEKREIISFFEDENIIAIDSWTIMGKLLVQTSLTSGLEMVYNEILSFDGCEVYFHEDQWNNISFYDLAYYLEDGIPLGTYSEEAGLILRPDRETVLKNGDQVVILAEDDSTIKLGTHKKFSPKSIPLKDEKLSQVQKKILILGWHKVAEIFIEEATDYLIENSEFDILFHQPTAELEEVIVHLKATYPEFKINLIDSNPLAIECLEEINPSNYDNVIVLSQSMKEESADKIDSDTLIILLMLRKIITDFENTHLLTQVLNSENQEIINQTDVDDFIISNKLITMILAQLSEEPLIKTFYDDIFSEDGSEIYVKPTTLYFEEFPQKITFAEAMEIANKRDEICLGIRKGDLSKDVASNFGVTLNLEKDQEIELNANDFLVVLSEDEL
ncbi:CASTOR/POLLUX-related putative ion channel [Kordia sp.]|uniref:CASTOR/POLLUX-related putative ion channel n=1 Tax=Kordia sp. TaxID=1965332 RepID=UPI003D26EF01